MLSPEFNRLEWLDRHRDLADLDATPDPTQGAPSYVVGLDLGQASDFSAVCVVESFERDGARNHNVRHLHRWKLGTPYTAVVADVARLGARRPLPGCPLVVDATGVGKAVVDIFRQAKLPLRMVPVTITAGHEATPVPGGWSCPKKDLVATMQSLVQFRRLHIAPGLPEAATLGRELQQFRVKVTAAGNETFEAWRERDHDDLVLSVALACWWGRGTGRRLQAW